MEGVGIIQARDYSGSDQNNSSGDSEKCFGSGYYLKLEPIKFPNILNVRHTEQSQITYHDIFSLSNWKNGFSFN